MPRFLSCGEVRVKRASQEGILEAWVESLRPIKVRKVVVSGTKGVGLGTGGMAMGLWRRRCCCWFWWFRGRSRRGRIALVVVDVEVVSLR